MFSKFKEKLKSWFKKAEKKVEETAGKEEKALEKKAKKEETKKLAELKLKPAEKEEKEARKEIKKGLFEKIKEKFKFKVTEQYFEEIFSELEMLLLENNVALEIVEKIKENLKEQLIGKEVSKDKVGEEIKSALQNSIKSLLKEPFDIIEKIKAKQETFVIIFFGINGSGKTTTIAKIASLLQKNNLTCILAASDTFRAASIEQLEKHAKNLGVKVIKSKYGADPASVAFDAIKHAQAHNISCVLVDTAGRMYTKQDLMREMGKIARVSRPDLKIFVAESITGNDAVEQAKSFNEAVGIDAVILTKADIDERGGAAISVNYITKKPILYLGVGQGMEDLKKFDKEELIKSLGLE
jgi:fused signal recognition particle receptor